MYTIFWSVKGGAGASTVAALWALASAAKANPTFLVDLCGDVPALLGEPEPDGPGVSDWCQMPEGGSAALSRIATRTAADLSLIHRGSAPWPEPSETLALALGDLEAIAVVDAGMAPAEGFAHDLVRRADQRLLVVRNGYVDLRAAADIEPLPTGVVLVRERGRALGSADVESVIGAPVIVEIEWDLAIARCADAGLLTSRPPRSLLRSLARLQRHAPL